MEAAVDRVGDVLVAVLVDKTLSFRFTEPRTSLRMKPIQKPS